MEKDDLDQYIENREEQEPGFKQMIERKNLNLWPMQNTIFDECLLKCRKYVNKGWGYILKNFSTEDSGKINSKIGEVFVYHKPFDENILNPETVKILYVDKGKTLSTHFHVKKTEIFYCVHGSFKITLTKDGKTIPFLFEEGQSMLIRPGMVHAIFGLDNKNILLEVSTLDTPEDSYRIKKGD